MKKIFAPWILPILQWFRRRRYYFIYKKFSEFTMIPGDIYVTNLELCRHHKVTSGEIVECGTWKGGMIAGMKMIMGDARTYHLFDSFEGLPDVKEIDGVQAKSWQEDKSSAQYFDNCTASEDDAKRVVEKARIVKYSIHKGWFKDTLSHFRCENGIAILRLDGDWYDSTMECLVHLFPQVNTGGLIIVDDYYRWEGCSKAVHDYLSLHKSSSTIKSYRGICYIIKK